MLLCHCDLLYPQVEPSIVDVTSLPVAAFVDVIVVVEPASVAVVVDAAFVVISGQTCVSLTLFSQFFP